MNSAARKLILSSVALTGLIAVAAPPQTQAERGTASTGYAGPVPSRYGVGAAGADRGMARTTGTPSRPAAEPRPHNLPMPASTMVYRPSALARRMVLPEEGFWRSRDLFAQMRIMARRGFLEVTPVGEEVGQVVGSSWFPSGWRAYGFAVPPKEKLHVRLHHGNEGWFRLVMVNKWGQVTEGMLQNLIPTGNPEVTFKNPGNDARTVYVIVDDPGWMSSKENPFTLTVERSWDPGKVKLPQVPQVVGIWASRKPADPAAPVVLPEKAEAPKG